MISPCNCAYSKGVQLIGAGTLSDRRSDTHRAEQHRTAIAGVEANALVSNRTFPRHAHDQFGIGLIWFGAQRSWSGVGSVEAGVGEVITVNPGEMHDGLPVDGGVRCWRMLYLDPGIVARAMHGEMAGPIEIARPALRDDLLAAHFERLFARVIEPKPDFLALEEALLRTLTLLLRRHGSRPLRARQPPPCVARALQHLDDAPDCAATLTELAALSGVSRFQLLRGFSREAGATPHAYLLQRRVRLARRLLAAGHQPAEVAAEAGFADQSHMTRAFVRQLGVTPARFRAAVV